MSVHCMVTFSLYLLVKPYFALPFTCAKCSNLDQQTQIVFTTTPVNTFDISQYTCGQIKYLTAFGGQGDLSCSDTSNSITFQMSNSGAMRLLFGTTTPVNTFDISAYTCGQIKYLTAFGGQGDLSCSDTSNSITFQMSNFHACIIWRWSS
eukprot:288954_1